MTRAKNYAFKKKKIYFLHLRSYTVTYTHYKIK